MPARAPQPPGDLKQILRPEESKTKINVRRIGLIRPIGCTTANAARRLSPQW